MTLVRDMKLSKKLPLAITLPIVLFVSLAGLVLVWQFSNILNQRNQEVYSTLAQERATALERWLGTIEDDINSLASNISVTEAIDEFTMAWNGLGDNAADHLREFYIIDNPHPAGKKDELVAAYDGSRWSQLHERYHVALRSFQRNHGYHDLFLFDARGNLVYSVFKEDDFAMNFVDGPYADSGLGDVFKKSNALPADELYLTEIAPYAPSGGAPALFLAKPVFDGSRRIGVVALQVPFNVIGEILSDSALLGETGQVILTGSDGQILSSSASNESTITQAADKQSSGRMTPQIEAALAGETGYFADTVGLNRQPVVAATSSLVTSRGDRWGVVMEVDAAEALAANRFLQLVATLGLIATTLALTLTSWIVGRWIARRFITLSHDIHEIAEKNYSITVQGTDSNDEIGVMAQTLEDLKSRLEEGAAAQEREVATQKANARVVDLLSKALMGLAQGDFRNTITEFFPYEHRKLRYNINDAMGGLNQVISQVISAAHSIRQGAVEINGAADDLSRRTESQAATLEQTAAALEQITVSVRSATENVRTVETAASNAKAEAEQSGLVVSETIAAMTEIEASSKHISQIISVIDDIAFQTNLLALNAGVEAARAGEAGKGFAVVASEVRALAQRASDAALEIKTLIQKSSHQVDKGVELVGQTGEALKTIVERVTNISGLVTDIAKSSEEQSTTLGEINIGVSQLDKVTQDNAAMVEETTAASHLLRTDAQRLVDLMNAFKTDEDAVLDAANPSPLAQASAVALPGPSGDPTVQDLHAQTAGSDPADDTAGSEPMVANARWEDF
ncbi:methyl-accepting chemotaxis protein [Phaeobacter sp.]|uniref:methyl-accepting chemotaxis protein n=1 Tax=Phaeobacter sp. TaxID=1902409 RepID=UPI0025CD2458|nr:methyl-accepting chemotaxis protein [Phaeobacter sp.]